MKKVWARRTIVACMALCMLSAAGCRPDKDSREESTTKAKTERRADDEDEETTEAIKKETEAESEATTEASKKETDATKPDSEPPSKGPKTASDEPVKDPSGDEISEDQVAEGTADAEPAGERDVQRYIRAALNFYNEQAETQLKLVVFDSQIEETDEGYSFQVRSQDGKDANVLVAEVKVNTTTGEMRDEWDHVWNVEDYD